MWARDRHDQHGMCPRGSLAGFLPTDLYEERVTNIEFCAALPKKSPLGQDSVEVLLSMMVEDEPRCQAPTSWNEVRRRVDMTGRSSHAVLGVRGLHHVAQRRGPQGPHCAVGLTRGFCVVAWHETSLAAKSFRPCGTGITSKVCVLLCV